MRGAPGSVCLLAGQLHLALAGWRHVRAGATQGIYGAYMGHTWGIHGAYMGHMLAPHPRTSNTREARDGQMPGGAGMVYLHRASLQ